MIIIKLIGGLGNQMFQYAAGRRTAIANKTELKLDITGYNHQVGITPRVYMLGIFHICATIATVAELRKFTARKNSKLHKFVPLLLRLTEPFTKYHYIPQKYTYFTRDFLTIPDNSYLDGYWGGEKYFADIADVIRKDFTLKNKPDKYNSDIVHCITNCNSVSIHVRRSDYVTDKKTHDFHGVCGLGYYKKAVSFITKNISDPHFFIFSDDQKWCQANLRLEHPTIYVSHNLGKKDYEDMRLMSKCKHNIIANSTFSWWGAWLNNNTNKIVIAPKRLFNNQSINTDDLIPKKWVRI